MTTKINSPTVNKPGDKQENSMPPLQPKHVHPRRCIKALPLVLVMLCLAVNANAFEAVHDLEIQLTPAHARLVGIDRITVKDHDRPLNLFLGAAVVIDRLAVNGKETVYRRNGSRIVIAPPATAASESWELTIAYHGRFDDPAPIDPINTDNPGYGVTGTISPRGTLLLGGAGWYPSVAAAAERFRLVVVGPPGTLAVTAGRAVEAEPRPGLSVSAWQIDDPVEMLALTAGEYKVRKRADGHLQAATYFMMDDAALSDQYLQASLQYLAAYETLFGPYPFEKFAVVENFFPTGYGFPSFTLIGGRVLRLPFIIPTSLRHEIAHCWWGNGVLVDYGGGNWSEGLATYVSDYRYRELRGAAAARDYRRQMLRNYTELVPPGDDIPLTRFTSRRDPVTKAVGYDKAAMVFHMLRQRVGDSMFWETLRRLAAERMFKDTSWADIQAAFESACGCSLETFFRQWVNRAGAPQLALTQIERTTTAAGSRISGIIQQHGPVYELEVPIRLSSAKTTQTETIRVQAEKTPFEIQTSFVPERLEADPGIDLLRRLAEEEMPPTINRLKSARDLLVVLPDGQAADPARQAADRLTRALGIEHVEMIAAAGWTPEQPPARNILIMQARDFSTRTDIGARGLVITQDRFSYNEAPYDRRRHTYVGVYPHPERPELVAAVYLFGRNEDRLRVATKVPHYGRYSYLIFEKTRNVAKGTWPVDRSPLIHVWPSAPAG